MPHKGWYSRGYLPHFDGGGTLQFITFRLHDSIPTAILKQWEHDLKHLPERERMVKEQSLANRFIDGGHGACWLARPEIAALMESALLHFHDERYDLKEWVVMPNHVHVLARIQGDSSLPEVVHSWKSYVAKEANKLIGRRGPIWFRDYYDRYIRDEAHYANVVRYIGNNPVKAGLCRSPEHFAFGSFRRRDASGPS